jgi:trigger factor
MINEELEKKARYDSDVGCENQLLNKLIDENKFSVPQGMIKRQIHLMTENAKSKLVQKGFNKEELDKKDAEFEGRFKEDAARQVKLLFILDRIASEEKIVPGDDELKNAYKAISLQTGKAEDEVRAYYEKEGLTDNLLEKIREEKTIEFLLKNARITEKDI